VVEDHQDILLDRRDLVLPVTLDLLAALQLGRDRHKQVVSIERLGDVILGPHALAALDIFMLTFGGEEDEGDVHPVWLGPHRPEEIIAIHTRHHDVGDDQVGRARLVLEHLQARLTIGRRPHLVSVDFEDVANPFHQVQIILDNQNRRLVHKRSPARSS